MGYKINNNSKFSKPNLTGNIGIITSEKFPKLEDLFQSFYMHFYEILNSYLAKLNYFSLYENITLQNEKDMILPRFFLENKVDGIVVLGQLSSEYLNVLVNTGTSLVFLDFYDDNIDVDSIITDSFYSSYDITNYLIRNGHHDICFVGTIYAASSIQDRFLGYYKALLAHKIPFREDYIVSDRDTESGIIYHKFVLPKDLPTAFVCCSDQTAYRMIIFLKKLGYKIPDDFSVVGFNNDLYSSISEPAITTVEIDIDKMSKRAAEIIVDKINGQRKTIGRIIVKTTLVHNESVKIVSKKRVGIKDI